MEEAVLLSHGAGVFEDAIHRICNGYEHVSANQKMSFFGGMKCNFLAGSIRWVCSLDYPLLAGLKPVKS